jgi:hypothetical protein
MEIDLFMAAGLALPIVTTAAAYGAMRANPTPPRLKVLRYRTAYDALPKPLQNTARLVTSFYAARGVVVKAAAGVVSYRSSQIDFHIDRDVETKKIERTAHDLEHYLRASHVDVVDNSLNVKVSGTMVVSFNHAATRPVILSQIFRGGERPLEGSFVLGLDLHGKVLRLPMDTGGYPHTMVLGSTGSGKTICLLVIAVNAMYLGWDIYVLNPKLPPAERLTYGLWQLRDAGNVIYAQNYDDMATTASEIANSMEKIRRPTLVIVDEAADVLERLRDDISVPLGRIAQKGREYGIHLAIGVPKSTKDVLFNDMLHANVGTTMVGMRMNSGLLSHFGTGVGGMDLHLLAGEGHCKVKIGPSLTEGQVALPDNLDRYKAAGESRRIESSNLLPVTLEWIGTLAPGDPVSKALLREYAHRTNRGLGYQEVQNQYDILLRQGRLEQPHANRQGVKVK